ncbi:hypothetical protein GF402_03680 [Candidatus Fermentibacteria bacterium]|nr:hypothetical protein [Candidatus Fermentibacteria bacterium]
MSLKDCRLKILNSMLDLIWSQWTTIGVSGDAPITKTWIIDPEALILFTCRIGRYDPRVFDAMLEWLGVHQRFINVQRLKTLNRRKELSGGRLLAAIANLLLKPSSRSKWNRLADQLLEGEVQQEPLFYLKDGRPHPHPNKLDPDFEKAGFSRQKYRDRNAIVGFRPECPSNLILKLRALLGTNSRCEIVAYLATHSEGNPSEIASAVGYSQKAVYNAVTDLYQSGTLSRRKKGKETLYSLKHDDWSSILSLGQPVQWMDWREAYSFLNSVWIILDNPALKGESDEAISPELRLVIARALPDLSGSLRAHLEGCTPKRGTHRESLAGVCNCIREMTLKLKE